MNNQLKASVSDLKKSLEKALVSSGLVQNIELGAKAAGDAVADVNRVQYPKIQTSIARTGKFSFAISFSAPMLWTRAFGSQSSPAQPFVTQTFVTNVNFGGLRGDA